MNKEINIKQIETKYKIKDHQKRISELQNKADFYNYLFFIVGLIISLITVVFLYNRYKIKSRMNKKLEEKNIELERMYINLLAAKCEADKLIKLKEDIIRNMSHEIRTPFNNIFGYLKLLNAEIDPEKHPNSILYLDEINNISNSLLGLLNDIFDLSQIENNEFKTNKQTFLVNDVIKGIIRKYQSETEKKKIEFNLFEIDDLVVNSDIKIMERIFSHLIDNAVKYTPKGKITIKLKRITVIDSPNLLITIEDTGIGIPEADLKKVFEPFTQSEMTTARSFEGAGLGLTITKKFVELLNGDIKISSKLGLGTKISVYLYSGNDTYIE